MEERPTDLEQGQTDLEEGQIDLEKGKFDWKEGLASQTQGNLNLARCLWALTRDQRAGPTASPRHPSHQAKP